MQVKGGDSDAGWTGLTNLYGSMWELDTQPQLPLDIHITADSGQEVGPTAGFSLSCYITTPTRHTLSSMWNHIS